MINEPTIGDFKLIEYQDPQPVYKDMMPRLFIVLILMEVLMTVAVPFIISPLLYNTEKPSLKTVLSNLVPAWRWAGRRYGQVMAAFIGGAVWIFVFVLTLSVMLTVTGVGLLLLPWLWVGAGIIFAQLLAMAFGQPPTRQVE
jgi:hypothetical protein